MRWYIPERDLRCSFSDVLGPLFMPDFDEDLEEVVRLVLETLVVGLGEASEQGIGGGGEGALVKGAMAGKDIVEATNCSQ
jgi:hypothetical protein